MSNPIGSGSVGLPPSFSIEKGKLWNNLQLTFENKVIDKLACRVLKKDEESYYERTMKSLGLAERVTVNIDGKDNDLLVFKRMFGSSKMNLTSLKNGEARLINLDEPKTKGTTRTGIFGRAIIPATSKQQNLITPSDYKTLVLSKNESGIDVEALEEYEYKAELLNQGKVIAEQFGDKILVLKKTDKGYQSAIVKLSNHDESDASKIKTFIERFDDVKVGDIRTFVSMSKYQNYQNSTVEEKYSVIVIKNTEKGLVKTVFPVIDKQFEAFPVEKKLQGLQPGASCVVGQTIPVSKEDNLKITVARDTPDGVEKSELEFKIGLPDAGQNLPDEMEVGSYSFYGNKEFVLLRTEEGFRTFKRDGLPTQVKISDQEPAGVTLKEGILQITIGEPRGIGERTNYLALEKSFS